MLLKKSKPFKKNKFDDDNFDDFDDDLDKDKKDKDFLDKDFNNDNDYSFNDFGNSESPIDKHGDLFKDLTNFDPYLQKQVAEWLGMYWSEDKQKYVRDKSIDPIMNIKGARWCVNQLRTYARNNNLITQLDKTNYDWIYLDLVDVIYLNIGTRAEEFGIKNDGDIILVCNQLLHSCILVLLGAGGTNNYKDMFTKTTNRSESVNLNTLGQNNQPKESAGFLSRTKRLFFGG